MSIPCYEFKERRLFRNRYPCDLANPDLWCVAVHIINEGHLHKVVNTVGYTNNDPVLHFYFKRAVEL